MHTAVLKREHSNLKRWEEKQWVVKITDFENMRSIRSATRFTLQKCFVMNTALKGI
jgi:hypothetical protein